jgi:hypothetical protein
MISVAIDSIATHNFRICAVGTSVLPALSPMQNGGYRV